MLKLTIRKGEKVVTVYLAKNFDKYLKPTLVDPVEKEKLLKQLAVILFTRSKKVKDDVFLRAAFHTKQDPTQITLLVAADTDVTELANPFRGPINSDFDTDCEINIENFPDDHAESKARDNVFLALNKKAHDYIQEDLTEANLQNKIQRQIKIMQSEDGLAKELSQFIAEQVSEKVNSLQARKDEQAGTQHQPADILAYQDKAISAVNSMRDRYVAEETKRILQNVKYEATQLIASIQPTADVFEQQKQLASLQEFTNVQRKLIGPRIGWIAGEIKESIERANANVEKLKELTAKIGESKHQLNYPKKDAILKQSSTQAKELVKGKDYSGLPEQVKAAAIQRMKMLLRNVLVADNNLDIDYLDYTEILVELTGVNTDLEKLRTAINAVTESLQDPAYWQKFDVLLTNYKKTINTLDDVFSTINTNLGFADDLNKHLKRLAAIQNIHANYIRDDIQSIIRQPGFSVTDLAAQIEELPDNNDMDAQMARLLAHEDKLDPTLLAYIREANSNYNKNKNTLTQTLSDKKRDIDEVLLCHDYVNSIFNFTYWQNSPWRGERVTVNDGTNSFSVPKYIADMVEIIKNADSDWATNTDKTLNLMMSLQGYARENKINVAQENELHLGFLIHIAPPAQSKPQPHEISSSLRKQGILPADQKLANQDRIRDTIVKMNIWQRNPNLKKTLQGVGIGLAIGLPIAAVVGFFLWPVFAVAVTVAIAAAVAVGIAVVAGIIGRAVSKSRNKDKPKVTEEVGSQEEAASLLGSSEENTSLQIHRQAKSNLVKTPLTSPGTITAPKGTPSTTGKYSHPPARGPKSDNDTLDDVSKQKQNPAAPK